MLLSQVDIVAVWPIIVGAAYMVARLEVIAYRVKGLEKVVKK